MKFAGLCLFCLVGCAAAASFRASDVRASDGTKSPVEKIVQLLKDLQAQLESDEKEETMMYNKYACWCEKTSKRKAQAIVDATNLMRQLSQKILSLRGKIATLTSEIEQLEADLKTNRELQESSTNIRQKENAAYMAESAETKDALAALQKAIKVLVEATLPKDASAMLQESTHARMRMAVKNVLASIPDRVSMALDRVSLLNTFTTAEAAYAPQSATIQGILVDMYTTFASDLEAATLTEANANRKYETLMATLVKAEKQMEADKASKEEEKAKAEEDLAEATATYDDTKAQKEADIKFFDETKKACTAKSEEWNLRKKLRDEEMMGVAKAIAILTTDESRELFASAIKPGDETKVDLSIPVGFMQVSAVNAQAQATEMRSKAYTVLKAQATKARSFRIGMLAVNVRNAKVGHFEPVIKAIDEMIEVLKAEGAADIKKRDQCIQEYQTINLTSEDLMWKIRVNEATIEKLQKKRAELEEEKAATIAEIVATKEDLAALRAVRDKEHAEFLKAKGEDEEVIKILKGAVFTLSKYYKDHGIKMGPIQGEMQGLELRQEPVYAIDEDQAPDATFSHKGSRKYESKDIISMLTRLIEDSQDEIRNSITAEENAQAEYDAQKAAGEKLIADLTTKKTNLEAAIAKTLEDEEAEDKKKDKNEGELDEWQKHLADIKPDCDWIIGAFTKRADARASEMDGLTTAKDYLAGAQGSFLQKKKFDDNAFGNLRFLGVSH